MKGKPILSALLAFILAVSPLSVAANGEGQDLYAANISPETTVSSLGGVTVKHQGEILDGNSVIATEDIIEKDGYEFIAVVMGDVNGDGDVNSTDFMQIRRAYLGLFSFNVPCQMAADVNGDGFINSTDFMQIRRHYLGVYEIKAEGDIVFSETALPPEENTPPEDVTIPEETPSENVFSITKGGTYTFSGQVTDKMITVDAQGEDVNIILNGFVLINNGGPAIFVRAADNVTLTLAQNTENELSDGASYSVTDSGSTLDAAIFSKADFEICGEGKLTVNGNYKHGIVSKDDLVITSGELHIISQKVALNGKDCVKIYGGSVTLNGGSDGIRSDNEEDTTRGYVEIYGGDINITAGNDGIQAETFINIEGGNISVKSGKGSSSSLTSSDESYKGIKAQTDITIKGGVINVDSQDDSIHSNGTVNITGGDIIISSGDDGIHADTDLSISGEMTKITVLKSYEGIEALNLSILNGDINITASDDGLNAAGGNNDSSGENRPGQGFWGSSSNGSIKIGGGKVYIKADGDCIDANGTLEISDGDVTAACNINGDTAILDFDSTGNMNGGIFVGYGASGMSQNFSTSSAQGVIMLKVSSQSAGAEIILKDESGNVLFSRTADRGFNCVIISCADIVKGNTYTVIAGNTTNTVTMTSNVYSSSGGGGGGGGWPGWF